MKQKSFGNEEQHFFSPQFTLYLPQLLFMSRVVSRILLGRGIPCPGTDSISNPGWNCDKMAKICLLSLNLAPKACLQHPVCVNARILSKQLPCGNSETPSTDDRGQMTTATPSNARGSDGNLDGAAELGCVPRGQLQALAQAGDNNEGRKKVRDSTEERRNSLFARRTRGGFESMTTSSNQTLTQRL